MTALIAVCATGRPVVIDLTIALMIKQKLAVKARIAITFVIYHLAYGLGTFLGIVNVITENWENHLGKPLKRRYFN